MIRLLDSPATAAAAPMERPAPARACCQTSIAARRRLLIYAPLLIVLGGFVCFYRLGERMLVGDEAAFASTTDLMRSSGDWVVPRLVPESPHLNATPLYNWLTLLTENWLPEGRIRYRAWSALFGIGCALAALALGTLLFRPEVGLLAGLLLLTNFHFLFMHAARDGCMEAGLALFVTVTVFVYARLRLGTNWPRLHWCLIGAGIGAAWMMKPPVMGGFFFAAIVLHHLIADRQRPWWGRVAGPFIALAVAVVLAAPWYIALSARLGDYSFYYLLVHNSVGRAMRHKDIPHMAESFAYWRGVWNSSHAFGFALAAFAWGGLCALVAWRRGPWLLLCWMAGSFTLALSCAAEQHFHYLYSVFPILSVMAAAMLLDGFKPAALSPRWQRGLHLGAIAAGVLALAFVLPRDVARVRAELRRPRWDYPPLVLHERLAQADLHGHVRLVLYDFPQTSEPRINRALGFVFLDRYYATFLPAAFHVDAVPQLNDLIQDGRPALVLLPPGLKPAEIVAQGIAQTPDRQTLLRSDRVPYPLLAFNGALQHPQIEEVVGRYEMPDPHAGR
jgi:4-amino-4-deoxy-L-arabinose transferase-like glycosyltransferase